MLNTPNSSLHVMGDKNVQSTPEITALECDNMTGLRYMKCPESLSYQKKDGPFFWYDTDFSKENPVTERTFFFKIKKIII